jgi:hypothetical protein
VPPLTTVTVAPTDTVAGVIVPETVLAYALGRRKREKKKRLKTKDL